MIRIKTEKLSTIQYLDVVDEMLSADAAELLSHIDTLFGGNDYEHKSQI